MSVSLKNDFLSFSHLTAVFCFASLTGLLLLFSISPGPERKEGWRRLALWFSLSDNIPNMVMLCFFIACIFCISLGSTGLTRLALQGVASERSWARF